MNKKEREEDNDKKQVHCSFARHAVYLYIPGSAAKTKLNNNFLEYQMPAFKYNGKILVYFGTYYRYV